MRCSLLVAALAAPTALAFPWMMPEGLDSLMKHPDAQPVIKRRLAEYEAAESGKVEARQLGTSLVPGLVSLLGGTLTAVYDSIVGLIPTPDSVKGLKKFPEPDYPFKAPGPNDQRGQCPGLNTLANHGYIPRNGIATVGQLNAGTARLFNMGVDLSNLLSVGAVVEGGDIHSQKVSIGGPDSRVGVLNGALNSIFGTPTGISGHGKFNEGDASATRLDFYLNNGDDLTFIPELFKQMHQQALAKGDGTYSVDAIKEHFKNRYAASRSQNAEFYFNLPSAAVVMGAYYFIPAFFSNGTLGLGGVANEASITSFYGAKPKNSSSSAWMDPNLEYTHVPERIPERGWYRRATPLTIPEAAAGILDVYLYAKPAIGGAGADQNWVLGPLDIPNNPQAFSCFLYNAIYANFPSELFNALSALAQVVNFVGGALAPGYKALGCTVNFPQATGIGSTYRSTYETWAKQYTGDAKTQAVGSGWYKKS
ncbi:Aromatic peroxygenase [Coniochaeta hoffmannii]|uniref:Aromatic peroxygenase n=1 Tax=Coniochaeta hoffmannii TaxID=91930 RepID=A0AA38W1H9_9PEZI|nr:Aromatic peroxygenase [Coniochaeta hoffmannii]